MYNLQYCYSVIYCVGYFFVGKEILFRSCDVNFSIDEIVRNPILVRCRNENPFPRRYVFHVAFCVDKCWMCLWFAVVFFARVVIKRL